MNILFLTLADINSIDDRGIYTDLLRCFVNNGHQVTVVCPKERRNRIETNLLVDARVNILQVKTFNIQKTNIIEKGVGTLAITYQYLAAIKKYFLSTKFDLVLYSTPPITITRVIKTIKKRDNACTYLLLKDIFPQNAVDLGMIKNNGLIYRYFRWKEKQLYHISDFIGCMSLANVDYVIRHNPEINPKIVEVNPNSIEPDFTPISKEDLVSIRNRFNIPPEVTAFIYGGNLGKPQGIDFLLDVLNSNKERQDIFFVIVGGGTEFLKVQTWFTANNPGNAELLAGLPKNEYDQLIQSCDVGLIFLDRRFTIPNFPSRLLSYLEYKMPVIAATDINTDLGRIMEENKFGFWAKSGDLLAMNQCINKFAHNKVLISEMGQKGFDYMETNYTVSNSYMQILNHFKK